MAALRDSPLEFTRAQRTFAFALIAAAFVGYSSPYWLPAVLGPGELPRALGEEEMAEFREEILEWTARNDALADSLARERAARDSAYAARRAYYAERDRRRAARQRRERDRGDGDSRRASRYAIDTSIPLPARGTVDPNRADSVTLRRLGIPHYVVSRLLKYRVKAGGFRESDEVAKLYGLEDSTFARIRGYLVDGPLERPPRDDGATPVRGLDSAALRRPVTAGTSLRAVDVNEASEADLEAVRGIGPFYAKQILDYRDRLGGFVDVAQVAETPKLREGAYEQWAGKLRVSRGAKPTTPLRVNDLDARALARHPYLPYSKAATLVAYRGHHGPFRSVSDVYAVVALDSGTVERLGPYLDFGN